MESPISSSTASKGRLPGEYMHLRLRRRTTGGHQRGGRLVSERSGLATEEMTVYPVTLLEGGRDLRAEVLRHECALADRVAHPALYVRILGTGNRPGDFADLFDVKA